MWFNSSSLFSQAQKPPKLNSCRRNPHFPSPFLLILNFTHEVYIHSLNAFLFCSLSLSFALRSLRLASVGNIMECNERRKRREEIWGEAQLSCYHGPNGESERGSCETTVDPWSRFIENVRLQSFSLAQMSSKCVLTLSLDFEWNNCSLITCSVSRNDCDYDYDKQDQDQKDDEPMPMMPFLFSFSFLSFVSPFSLFAFCIVQCLMWRGCRLDPLNLSKVHKRMKE